MKAKEVIKEIKNNGVSIASSEEKQLIKIQGTLTSSLQLRGENIQEPYYYAFIKLKGQKVDLPTIFKIKDDQGELTKPNLKKSDEVELIGNYSNSQQNVRKSFTACSYQLLNEKRIRKKCFDCGDTFTCYQLKNYDYCRSCEINGNRYVFRESKCSECDGSGWIKFRNQLPRSCKTCYLDNRVILEQAKSQLPELEAEAEKISQARQQLEK